jgi:8-oxo-dGTP pyrophosphatase MutT (NUDIX family)
MLRGGEVLAISRRGDPSALGFPGGSVEPGERPAAAAIREMREETGFAIPEESLQLVFMGTEDGSGATVATYLVADPGGQPQQLEAGVVTWTGWPSLLNGPFGAYNARVRAALFQQHMLKSLGEYRAFLSRINLVGRVVVEVGVGTGALTVLILAWNPDLVIGYEIDRSLPCPVASPLFDLRTEDFASADLSYVDARHCLIANPPYSLLTTIGSLVNGDDRCFDDVILMVPEDRIHQFPGFRAEFTLSGGDFDPPASGRHAVTRRGFSGEAR